MQNKIGFLKLTLMFFLVLFSCTNLFSAGYVLNETAYSARSIAIGNIGDFSFSSDAVFYNPASLYSIASFSTSVSYSNIISDSRNIMFSIAKKQI